MKRGGPLKRVPMPPRKAPLDTPSPSGKPVQRKPGKHVGESKAREQVALRSGGDCEVRLLGICLGRATNWHHRQNRSQQGKWDVRNGLHVCGSGTTGCHGALTNTNGRRSEFESYGWLVPSHQDPAEVECLIYTRWFGHDYVRLLDEYPWVELAEFPAGDPRHPDDIERPREPRDLDGVA